MKRLVVDEKELPIFVETIDGQDVLLFAERRDSEGGIVTNVLVDDGNGNVRNHRTFRGAGSGFHTVDGVKVPKSEEELAAGQAEALAVFQSMDKAELRERAILAALPEGADKAERALRLASAENVRAARR